MANSSPTWLRWIGRTIFIASVGFCVVFTFELSTKDEAALRLFELASHRWQTNPEFRSVGIEYTTLGSKSMQAHVFMVPSTRVIVFMRSMPWLPKELAVNPTSWLHYDDFSHGSLSAYLHLCSEQNVRDLVNIFTAAGNKGPLGDEQLVGVLDNFHMDFPVIKDTGARQSLSDLIRDTDAGRGFSIHEDLTPRLLDPIRHIATQLNLPTDPTKMTPLQQQAVFERLDNYIHASDTELWRVKQLNDFGIGIWAQVYGPEYKSAILPVLYAHDASRFGLLLLLGLTLVWLWRRRAAYDAQSAQPAVAEALSYS